MHAAATINSYTGKTTRTSFILMVNAIISTFPINHVSVVDPDRFWPDLDVNNLYFLKNGN